MSNEVLVLTPKRLALLDAVAEGRVKEHHPLLPAPVYSLLDRGEDAAWPPSRWVKVTAEVAKLNRAGLVALDMDHPRLRYKDPRVWQVTEIGERRRREARASEGADHGKPA